MFAVAGIMCERLEPPAQQRPAGATPMWIDCVGALHVRRVRGREFGNVRRFGQSNPALRTTARIADLASDPSLLSEFCDWEACARTNGYNHTCWLNDAGWERCRVCDGGADCNGDPVSRDDCMARALAPNRAQCHVGLLQECIIQRGLRGAADPRVTQACRWSEDACSGRLPGDASAKALAAQHETHQVTVELMLNELDQTARDDANAPYVQYWRQELGRWDGGLPPDALDAGALDAGAGDR